MKKQIFTSTAALMLAASLMAVPAKKGMLTLRQPDGTTVTFCLHGDENHHVYLTTDGYRVAQDKNGFFRYMRLNDDGLLTTDGSPIVHDLGMRSEEESSYINRYNIRPFGSDDFKAEAQHAKAMKAAAKKNANERSNFKIGSFPTIGKGKWPVILVEFPECSFTLDNDFHKRMLNERGYSENGFTGSARDYFYDQSMGLFEPEFDVIGPVKLDRPESYYGADDAMMGNDVNAGQMIKDACLKASQKGLVDFSQYDGDGDGTVDMVYVVYAGYGQNAGAPSSTVWPHKYQLSGHNISLELDGTKIDTYACSAELAGTSGSETAGIGTVCHEFGHVLGLADHYNVDDGTDLQFGGYDIMDYGAYNKEGKCPPSYTAFERWTLGWLTPTEIADPEDAMQLTALAADNEAYLIGTSNPDEFYLLENRQQTGWDEGIKGEGMMITHVDFSVGAWLSNTCNVYAEHPRVTMIAADNEKKYDLIAKKETEKYDLYPMYVSPFKRNNAFTDESTPAAKPFTGETLNKWVTGIKHEDGIITFDFMANCLKTPKGLAATDIHNNGFTATWDEVDKADSYNVNLYRMRYVSEQPVALEECFDGLPLTWESSNASTSWGWCQMGKQATGGYLVTPELNLKRFDGRFTVALTVKSEQGKQPVLTVSANGQQGKTRLTSTERTYVFHFNSGFSKTKVKFETNNERAYIDTICIVRGDTEVDFPSMKEIEVTGDVEFVEGEVEDNELFHAENVEVTGIKGLQHTFTGLDAQANYVFTVTAVNSDKKSRASEEYAVFTDGATGIGNTQTTNAGSSDSEQYFTLDGRRYNGQPQKGLYIVKKGTAAKKVIK